MYHFDICQIDLEWSQMLIRRSTCSKCKIYIFLTYISTYIWHKIYVKYMWMMHFELVDGRMSICDHSRSIQHVSKWYTRAHWVFRSPVTRWIGIWTVYIHKYIYLGSTYHLRDFRGKLGLVTCLFMLGFSTKLTPKYLKSMNIPKATHAGSI